MRKMTMIQYKEVKAKRQNDNSTTVLIKPLERGFASTIGTALRRTILSSITAVAPFAIKIKGLEHEFATMKGVVEDAQAIILNVRGINFVYDSKTMEQGQIYRGTINSSSGTVFAGDLKFDDQITIFNPRHEIAHLSNDTNFHMEVFVRVDRGFVDFEANKVFIAENETDLIGNIKRGNIIAVDSDFSPVKKVAIKISEINTSSVHIEEQLELEIETNGTVSAKEIIAQASQILIGHLQVFGDIDNLDKINIFEEKLKSKSETNTISSKEIKDLPLSVRSINALYRQGYTKLSDIQSLTEDDLASVKNLGKKSVQEIKELLIEYGLNMNKGEE